MIVAVSPACHGVLRGSCAQPSSYTRFAPDHAQGPPTAALGEATDTIARGRLGAGCRARGLRREFRRGPASRRRPGLKARTRRAGWRLVRCRRHGSGGGAIVLRGRQIWPDAMPVVRAQIATGNGTFRGPLNRQASIDGCPPRARPLCDKHLRHPQCFSQSSAVATLGSDVL